MTLAHWIIALVGYGIVILCAAALALALYEVGMKIRPPLTRVQVFQLAILSMAFAAATRFILVWLK